MAAKISSAISSGLKTVRNTAKEGVSFIQDASLPDDMREAGSQTRQEQNQAQEMSTTGQWSKTQVNKNRQAQLNNNENLALSNTGELNRKTPNEGEKEVDDKNQTPEQNENIPKNLGPIGEDSRRRRLAQKFQNSKLGKGIQNVKTKVANHKIMAKKATRLGTFAAYKFSWQYLIPSFGLTWFYLAFHFLAKYIMGGPGFCHFVSVTNPAVATKEIIEGKDKMDFGAMIAFVLVGVIIITILAFAFTMLFIIVYAMTEPLAAAKEYIEIIGLLIKEIMTGVVKVIAGALSWIAGLFT